MTIFWLVQPHCLVQHKKPNLIDKCQGDQNILEVELAAETIWQTVVVVCVHRGRRPLWWKRNTLICLSRGFYALKVIPYYFHMILLH